MTVSGPATRMPLSPGRQQTLTCAATPVTDLRSDHCEQAGNPGSGADLDDTQFGNAEWAVAQAGCEGRAVEDPMRLRTRETPSPHGGGIGCVNRDPAGRFQNAPHLGEDRAR